MLRPVTGSWPVGVRLGDGAGAVALGEAVAVAVAVGVTVALGVAVAVAVTDADTDALGGGCHPPAEAGAASTAAVTAPTVRATNVFATIRTSKAFR